MITRSEAIVLRVVRYSDTRWLVDMLTREWGRCTFVCTVSKRGKGLQLRNLLQPLTQLDIQTDYRARQDVQRLDDAQIAYPYFSFTSQLEKLSVGLFLAELLYYSTRATARDEGLFDFIATYLRWFDQSEQGVANFHLLFVVQLAKRLGLFPNVEDYAEGWVFDLRDAVFTPTVPAHADFVPTAEAVHLIRLLRMSVENYRHFRLSHAERNRILDYVLLYYRLHVPGFPELKSLEVVRQLYV